MKILLAVDDDAPTDESVVVVDDWFDDDTTVVPLDVGGDPADSIVETAREIDAELIVIGTDDRSWLSRLIHPSVSADLAGQAPCSVLVVRPSSLEAEAA